MRDRRDDVSDRYRVIIDGQIIIDGKQSSVVVMNLSARGLGGRSGFDLKAGTPVTIGLASVGTVSAIVAWARGNRFGLQLSSPIDPTVVVPTRMVQQQERRRR